MLSKINLAESFSRLLSSQVEHIQDLLGTLEEEYRLLQGTNPALLEQLTQQKQQQIEEIENLVSEQNQVLQQLGYPPDRHGIEAHLDNLDSPSLVREYWIELENLLEASRRQNTINGNLVASNKRQVSQALDLLHGTSAGQKTYGPSGESQSNHLTSSLGKA